MDDVVPDEARAGTGLELVVRRGTDLAADVDDLVVAYVAANAPGNEDVRARRAVIVAHAANPDAVGILALRDDRLVGFCYGTRSQPGQWWHDHVSAALTSDQRERWLRDSFVINEVAVVPDVRGAGLGHRLVGSILRTPEAARRRAVLLSARMDNPAERLYRRFGFCDIVTDLPFVPVGLPYRVMGLARAARPDQRGTTTR